MSLSKSGIVVCVPARKNCYAHLWSYGQICVGCGCCGPPSKKRTKARFDYWKWWLKEQRQFDSWADDPEMRQMQERNRGINIAGAKRHIRYYRKRWLEGK